MTKDEDRFRKEIFETKVYGDPVKGVVVNIGAHVGLLEEYMHDTATMMYAIEPAPANYQELRDRVKNWSNVKTYNTAIGGSNTIRKLYQGDSDGAWSFSNNWDGTSQDVPVITLEDFMKREGIEHIDLLKIDCEGAESEIIFTPEFANIADKIDVIAGELHGAYRAEDLIKNGFEIDKGNNPQIFIARRING